MFSGIGSASEINTARDRTEGRKQVVSCAGLRARRCSLRAVKTERCCGIADGEAAEKKNDPSSALLPRHSDRDLPRASLSPNVDLPPSPPRMAPPSPSSKAQRRRPSLISIVTANGPSSAPSLEHAPSPSSTTTRRRTLGEKDKQSDTEETTPNNHEHTRGSSLSHQQHVGEASSPTAATGREDRRMPTRRAQRKASRGQSDVSSASLVLSRSTGGTQILCSTSFEQGKRLLESMGRAERGGEAEEEGAEAERGAVSAQSSTSAHSPRS